MRSTRDPKTLVFLKDSVDRAEKRALSAKIVRNRFDGYPVLGKITARRENRGFNGLESRPSRE